MSAEKRIIKELDSILSSIRRSEQNIIGMDAANKVQIIEKLVALEDTVKSIQKNIDIPVLEITKDTEIYTLEEDEMLSVRACNVLMRSGCKTIADVLDHTSEEILAMRNMGLKAHKEIIEFLATNGFELKEERDG